jgi:hypothetical protein
MRYYIADSTEGPPASQSLGSVLDDVRTAFQRPNAGPTYIVSLLNLYGSITSLTARGKRIRSILDRSATDANGADSPTTATPAGKAADQQLVLETLSPAELREFDGFHNELIEFGAHLTKVNLAAVDIYYPGLRSDLLDVTGADVYFDVVYTEHIAPKHGLRKRKVPPTLATLLDQYSGDWGAQNVGGELLWEYGFLTPEQQAASTWDRPDTPTVVSRSDMVRILDLLAACNETIGSIVRENWQFSDLLRPAHEGIHVEMSEYNITGSQVGAVGPGARAHDMTFQQTNIDDSDIDAATLAAELDQLREELARTASERDQYADLVAVSDAAAEAREGRTAEALKKLTAVGKWALDVATKIGVTVATEALKRATGLV